MILLGLHTECICIPPACRILQEPRHLPGSQSNAGNFSSFDCSNMFSFVLFLCELVNFRVGHR